MVHFVDAPVCPKGARWERLVASTIGEFDVVVAGTGRYLRMGSTVRQNLPPVESVCELQVQLHK